MKIVFKGLLTVAFSLGLTCSAYSIQTSTYSQSQQPYLIANTKPKNTKPGGDPRMQIPEASRLTNLDNTQIS